MRVLVTGGTGYLGRAIVEALVARGHTPVVFARRASAAGSPGEAVDGDIRDQAAVSRAAAGCDAICHTAALVSVWRPDPSEFDAVNVGGLEHVLAAAKAHAIPRIVYTSSFLALAPAGQSAPLLANDYQRTKAAADRVARRAVVAGAPLVSLYPGVIYGPGLMSDGNLLGRMLADHVAGRLPGLVGPQRIWSFAWVDDVAAAHVAAIEHPRPAARYMLGGENAPQIRPFELLRDRKGVRLPRRLPVWAAVAAGVVEGWRARRTGRAPLLTGPTVQIFCHDWPLDSTESRADLGYQITPLATGMDRLFP